MKQCPSCKTTYTDDSLKFCLADGTALYSLADEESTVIRKAKNGRTDGIPSLPDAPIQTSSQGRWIKVALAVALLGVLAVGAVGLVAGIIYYTTRGDEAIAVAKSPTPTPVSAATPTPDAEKERLRDELSNIQKKLDEKKGSDTNTRPAQTPNLNLGISVTANSPADGFLALRSEPSSDSGTRIAKIPHGARLQIGACGDYLTTKKSNYGRWCRASYNGYSGWIFDKYVIY